ncbi:BTB/POZ domain-containing protein At1g50280-like [Phragmites australis]|uniref:BTB/POZ domain-containing protein At1g50280-like n=1 Tax=Phragmites australis TaxID=29695 RepID=UPI002D775811|nr:BTB/POZ domain-containing protein At1g50280-like [Phragmites australis]
MNELCDLKVHINGQHTLHLHQSVMCAFSGRLRTMVKQEKKKPSSRKEALCVKLAEFPGGAEGFELVARFCYNNGRVPLCPSNLPLLHCAAVFLEMTEEVCACNLLTQAEAFVNGLYYWTWADVLSAVKSCEPFAAAVDGSGLLEKLIIALFSKITSNPETLTTAAAVGTPNRSSSSCSSSPDTVGFGQSSSTKTPESMKPCIGREWWFDDLTSLSPHTIEKVMRVLGCYGIENKNLILTRFLLRYLRAATRRPALCKEGTLAGLADTAVHGVALVGGTAFSCRGLFWVLRIVSAVGLSKECKHKLERLMGLMLDQATLDDLLVSGDDGGVYDVNLVMRLVRVFVVSEEEADAPSQRMRKVGRLVDKYLGEISPDHGLKVSRFLAVAESLPDSARECYDGVYRALDIYLESHPALSLDERTTLCRCLNYEKLTLEACKDLAKNRRIPPGVAVQALTSQQSKLQINKPAAAAEESRTDPSQTPRRVVRASARTRKVDLDGASDEKELLRLNLQKMQNRVVELERACKDMQGQMSKMARGKSFGAASCHQTGGRGLPRLC